MQRKLTQSSAPLARRTARGFTLIELLVVIAILAVLATVVGVKVIPIFSKAKRQTAQLQIADIDKALVVFKLDVGRYPTNAEGLQALVSQPPTANGWNGPYLASKQLVDPWTNPYHYANPGPNGDVQILSYGADNAPGGEGENADIVNQQ